MRFIIGLLVAIAAGCTPADPAQSLRATTYNIAAGRGDLDAIAAVIEDSGADIVALQEVDVHWSGRSGFADQAGMLAERLSMNVRFGPIYRLPGATESDPPREFGLAILSRYPIVEFTNHEITRLSTQEQDAPPRPMPGFLEAVVQVRDVRVRVFDTHLDYRPDPRVRAAQAREMLDIIAAGQGPAILMGDMNARPDAPEIAPLLDALRDSWTGPGGESYPADAPDRRIDYILVSDDFDVVNTRVPDTRASDHRPVVADLLLRSSSAAARRPD